MEKRTNHGKRPSEQLQKLHFFIETRDRKEPPDSPPTPRSSSLLQPTSKHLLQVFAQKWPSRWSSWIIAAGHWSWWDSYFNVACILVWGSCLWGTEQWHADGMVWWSLALRIYCLLRNVNSAPGWFALIFMVTVALFSENGLHWTLA